MNAEQYNVKWQPAFSPASPEVYSNNHIKTDKLKTVTENNEKAKNKKQKYLNLKAENFTGANCINQMCQNCSNSHILPPQICSS